MSWETWIDHQQSLHRCRQFLPGSQSRLLASAHHNNISSDPMTMNNSVFCSNDSSKCSLASFAKMFQSHEDGVIANETEGTLSKTSKTDALSIESFALGLQASSLANAGMAAPTETGAFHEHVVTRTKFSPWDHPYATALTCINQAPDDLDLLLEDVSTEPTASSQTGPPTNEHIVTCAKLTPGEQQYISAVTSINSAPVLPNNAKPPVAESQTPSPPPLEDEDLPPNRHQSIGKNLAAIAAATVVSTSSSTRTDPTQTRMNAPAKKKNISHETKALDATEIVHVQSTSKDVLSHRGGGANNHEGCVRYREAAARLRPQYKEAGELSEAAGKAKKTAISQKLVNEVHDWDGRFLKKHATGVWYEMSDQAARIKCSQLLREEYTAAERAAKRRKYYHRGKNKKKKRGTTTTARVN